MSILNALTAASRSLRGFDALTRLVEDNQRQIAHLTRLVDVPAARRLHEQAIAMAEPMRRLQEEVAALREPTTRLREQAIAMTEPMRRLQEQVAALGEPTRRLREQARLLGIPNARLNDPLAAFEPSKRLLEQLKVFEPPQALIEQMKALAEPAKRLREQFAAFEAPARQWELFARNLNLGWLQDAEKLVEPFRIAERHVDRRVAKLLLRRGWLGVERHLSTWELSRLLDLRGLNKAARIDKFICSAFRRNRHVRLATMTKAWWRVPYLKARRNIIRQALRAHRRKEYALSVATLLPLVDGLAAEIRYNNPQPVTFAKGNAKKAKRRLIAVAEVVALYDPQGRVRDWADVVVEEVSKRMFKDYDFETERAPAKLNRHGVLHGRIAHYPSEVNSLKTVLMVDVMAHIALYQP